MINKNKKNKKVCQTRFITHHEFTNEKIGDINTTLETI